MKLKKILPWVMLAVPMLVILLAPLTFASSFKAGERADVAATESVDGSVYLAGQTVSVEGNVDGDVFCAGETVTITGNVTGDVICAGQTVTISGAVGGDVRLAGMTVLIDGYVQQNATVMGETVSVATAGRVGGDLQVGTSNFTMAGMVGRDLVLGAQMSTIDGIVGRNIDAEVDNLGLGGSSSVGGTISYTSENEAVISGNATVQGEVNWDQVDPRTYEGDLSALFATISTVAIIGLLVLALLLVLIMPQRLRRASVAAQKQWGTTFAYGVVFNLVAPVVLVFSALTVIGIPAAIVGGIILTLVWWLSGPYAAFMLGHIILKKHTKNAVWYMLLGAAIILALYLIPIVNMLTMLGVLWFGSGALLRSVKLEKPNYVK